MVSPSGAKDLNSHQRNTLNKIFLYPAGHNIEWRAVVSLLEAVGTVEQRNGQIAVQVGSETGFLDIPEDKDVDIQTVVDLRHLLAAAGYGIGAAEAGGHNRED
jgi:hypothetical protein